jgi:hypothetical protein
VEEDEACARLARHYFSLAGYPHSGELGAVTARGGPSRPLLLALAWLVARADLFARAHADAAAPALLAAPPGPDVPLPPYPADSAGDRSGSGAAEAGAYEVAYLESAASALDACRTGGGAGAGGGEERGQTKVRRALGHQTTTLAQRLWQTVINPST